ncbi:Pentatricopeptide repeat-containing protein At5g18390, mitochondrial [Linum grandiflorum]
MGVLLRSQKPLIRSLSEPHSSLSSLLSHLTLPPPSDSIPPPHSPILSTGSNHGGVVSSLSISSNGSSSFISDSLGFPRRCFRCYSSVSTAAAAAPDLPSAEKPPKRISFFGEIIQLISSGDPGLESKLDSMQFTPDLKSVREILRALNNSKVPALRFIDWIGVRRPDFVTNSYVCNLLLDNCGRCDDYEKMKSLLASLNQMNVCLRKDAFVFLVVNKNGDEVDEGALMEAVKKVVGMLSDVGGRVYLTGVQSLVELLANSVSFEMAKFVIGLSDKRVSYHSVLIKEMCKKHEFQCAKDEIEEMKRFYGDACNLDCQSVHNYMISTMLKAGKEDEAAELVQEMMGKGLAPDALTFEILICNAVAKGGFGTAIKFFDSMVEAGVEPRRSTHAKLLKMFFDLGRYEEAYSYAVAASERFKGSGDQTYCMLAELYRRKGELVMSKNVLCTMMSKGLAPDSFVYRLVVRNLKGSQLEEDAVLLEKQLEKVRFGNVA